MRRIALTVLLGIGVSGFAAANETSGADRTLRNPAPVAVTAIKTVVNQSRWKVELRNTENPHKFANGADVSAIDPSGSPRVQPVDMWIPWATSISEFRTHHISVVLKDASDHVVRRFAIWQRADFDGDFVRVGEALHASDATELPFAEPGTHIRGTPVVGGNRTLTVSVNGDLTLSGAR